MDDVLLPNKINEIQSIDFDYPHYLYKNIQTGEIFECVRWVGELTKNNPDEFKIWMLCVRLGNWTEYSFTDLFIIRQRFLHLRLMIEQSNKYMLTIPVIFPSSKFIHTAKTQIFDVMKSDVDVYLKGSRYGEK